MTGAKGHLLEVRSEGVAGVALGSESKRLVRDLLACLNTLGIFSYRIDLCTFVRSEVNICLIDFT